MAEEKLKDQLIKNFLLIEKEEKQKMRFNFLALGGKMSKSYRI